MHQPSQPSRQRGGSAQHQASQGRPSEPVRRQGLGHGEKAQAPVRGGRGGCARWPRHGRQHRVGREKVGGCGSSAVRGALHKR